MLDQNVKSQVQGLFANLANNYTFKIQVADNHSSKTELINLLKDVASVSDKVSCGVGTGEGLSFVIYKNDEPTSVIFKAVPTGHEFTTLLLAVLNLDGIGKNLPDETVKARIEALKGEVTIKSYISLSCTNCPDVVQALNIISFLNPNIKHEIIDGAINQDEVIAKSVQAVPSVFINDESLHVGRSSLGELLALLEEKMGSDFSAASAETKEYDVVIAGGGPAGVSAAIYSARKGFNVAIVAEKIGGQVSETVDIENMISVPKTTGSELSANLKQHLSDYPIDVLENRLIEEVKIVDGKKELRSSLGETFSTPALIIATGASWRKLNVPGESDYIGSGVAFCTHCDGPFYKGKKVAVIGGGNSGLEAAIDLSSIASEVTVLEFLDELKGDQVLQDKLAGINNVKILKGVATQNIEGDGGKVTGLNYQTRSTGEETKLVLDGVFVQIGLTANSKVFADIVETNRMGEIKIDANCRTGVPGVYAAGDVSEVSYKQIVIAMGEGSKAALSAFDDQIKGLQLSAN